MKKYELETLLIECVKEVISEDKININEIDFGGLFKSKPLTDDEIDAYLRSRPKDKAILDKDPERKAKWIEFVKSNKNAAKSIKNKAVVLAYWDPAKKEYSAQPSKAFVHEKNMDLTPLPGRRNLQPIYDDLVKAFTKGSIDDMKRIAKEFVIELRATKLKTNEFNNKINIIKDKTKLLQFITNIHMQDSVETASMKK